MSDEYERTSAGHRTADQSSPLREDLSILQIVALILREYRVLAAIMVLFIVSALVYRLVAPPPYVAVAKFVPQTSGESTSNLAGIAAQFGFAVPGDIGGGTSPEFYAAVIESREVVEAAALTEYRFDTGDIDDPVAMEGNYIDLYGIEAKDPRRTLTVAARKLEDAVSARTSLETGIVTVSVRARWAGLAEAIARRLLDLLNEFNLEKRQSQAVAERAFVENRVEEAGAELKESENALQQFLEENRSWEQSPQLSFERQRLQRQVDLQQQVYVSLAQSLEQARIEEVRDLPVLTLIEAPEGSANQAGSLGITLVLATIVGAAVGITWIVVKALVLAYGPEMPPELHAIGRRLSGMRGRLRRSHE